MNPFAEIQALISDVTNSVEVVRIIARDARGIAKTDRVALAAAADEMEMLQRENAWLHGHLFECRQQAAAISDQRAALEKKLIGVGQFPTISAQATVTGWGR